MLSDTDSGIVTIILVCPKSKSLLRKEIYGDFEKKVKSETPRKLRQIKTRMFHWNQHDWKPCIERLQDLTLNNKEDHFLPWVALISLRFSFPFFPGLVGYQNIIERVLTAHSKAISPIYVLFKNSTICKCPMGLKVELCSISQGVELPECLRKIFLMAHIKHFPHIIHTNSSIFEFQMTLKKRFWCHVSSGKAKASGLPDLLRVFERYCLYLHDFYQFCDQ